MINERFKQLRKFLKLSQTEMAEKLEKTLTMIQYYEYGTRTITDGILLKLNEQFNANINWLRSGEGEMFNSRIEGSVSAGSSHNFTLHEETIIKYYNELTEADKQEIFGYLQKAAEAKRSKQNLSDRIKKAQAG